MFSRKQVQEPPPANENGQPAAGRRQQLIDEIARISPGEAEAAAFFTDYVQELLARSHKIFWGDRMLTLDKSAAFMEDPHFAAAYSHIRGSHIYDSYDSPHTIAWRLNTLVWAARRACRLPGDFVECGVFKGDMSWVVTQTVDLARYEKKFYLYDSFAGFSDRYSSPEDYPDNPGFFAHADKVYKDESICPAVVKKFSAMPYVHVVRGFVPDSFSQALPDRISYLHMDLNSPAAEIAALEILFDRVVPGGVIVFDDYGWQLFRKQKDAEDAFLAARGYQALELPTGQGLVIK